MKLRNTTIIVLVTIFALVACVSNQPEPVRENAEVAAVTEPAPEYFLNSSEYKLLLNPDKFADMAKGFEAYWGIINEIATAEGIAVIPSEHPLKLKHKEVSFFDTDSLDLRKNGFLLRQKLKYKDGEKISAYEFAVKYRNPDPVIALSTDLSLAEGYTPKYGQIELESDIVYNSRANGATHTTFTVSNSIKLDEEPVMTTGTFATIYPILSKLNLAAETPLALVAGLAADEWMVVPGKLDFGDGLYGRMDMTVWILPTEAGDVLIPEFSFDHPFYEDRKYDDGAMEKCTEFINKLQVAYPEWVVPGALKAAAIFDMAD